MAEDPRHDGETIQATTGALYESISFQEGQRPNFDRLRSLLLPGARLVHADEETVSIMDIDNFIEKFERRLERDDFPSLEEREIYRTVRKFGNVASVFSTYEARVPADAPKPLSRGINSLQLVRVEGSWKIAGVFWDDEREGLPIPEEHLPLAPLEGGEQE